MITEKIASSSRDIRIIGNDLQLKFGERLEVWGTADGVKQVIASLRPVGGVNCPLRGNHNLSAVNRGRSRA